MFVKNQQFSINKSTTETTIKNNNNKSFMLFNNYLFSSTLGKY